MAEKNPNHKTFCNQHKVIPVGTRFDKLLVTGEPEKRKRSENSRSNYYYYPCLCECGIRCFKAVHCLRRATMHCCDDCLMKFQVERHTTHGKSKSSEYEIWKNMIRRCHSPSHSNYYKYGQRGISVCEQWRKSFESFIAYMGEKPSSKHSIDRFPNNDGNYEPGNCRWATATQQALNRRGNHTVTYFGKVMAVSEISLLTGINGAVIRWRLNHGWTLEEALNPTKPLHRRSLPKEK